MLDPMTTHLLETALTQAFKSATTWLQGAIAEVNKTKKYNMSACVSFIEAARAAIGGLEDELDQILIEAEQVSQYYWQKENRAELEKRISTYLTRDQLRHILDESLEGITKCHHFAKQDIPGFFGRVDQKKMHASNLLDELNREMHEYLVGLNQVDLVGLAKSTSYSEENYAGPSGLNIPELLDLKKLLEDKTQGTPLSDGTKVPDTEAERQRKVARIVDIVQKDRERRGFFTARKAKGVMQELIVAFRLEHQVSLTRSPTSSGH